MSLLTELKRRNVFRVAAAYAVVAWLLLQVGDVASGSLGFPEWFMPMLFVLLGLGFPVALLISWAFEMTPEGMKRTPAVDAKAGKASMGAIDGLLITLLVVVVGAIIYQALPLTGTSASSKAQVDGAIDASTSGPTGRSNDASIAVLPFIDLSAEGDQAYFSDGIAEEILNVLAGVEGLRVASRTSSFVFKGEQKSIPLIADELDVAHVLEGSVRKAGDRIRITAQLIHAADDAHLWSENYDRELSADNLFAIQDEIANAIVDALGQTMNLGRGAGIHVEAATENLDAYDLFLRARQSLRVLSTASAHLRVELLQRTVSLDPEYAEAWGQLAFALAALPTWDHSLAMAPYQHQSLEAAQRALAINPETEDAWIAVTTANRNLSRWEEFAQTLEEARKHIPDFDATPQGWLALGYLERARAAAERMQREDPEQKSFWVLIEGLALEAMGEHRRALEKLEAAVLQGYQGSAEGNMAGIYRRLGESPAANALLSRELAARDPELIRLLPYLHDLLEGDLTPGSADVRRFIGLTRELGFDVDELAQPSSTYGLRVPREVATAIGHADAVARTYFSDPDSTEPGGNSPKFWMWTPALQNFRRSIAFKQWVRDSGMLAYWSEHGWPDLCRPLDNDDFECD